MNEWEHVIVLDVCCTIKRPTTMCLAKKKKKENKSEKWDIGYCFWLSCFIVLFWCPVFGRISAWQSTLTVIFFFLFQIVCLVCFLVCQFFRGGGGGGGGELFGRTRMQKTMSAVTADLTATCGCFSLVPRATCMNMQHRLHPSPRTPACFQSQYLLIPKISSQNKYEINKAF